MTTRRFLSPGRLFGIAAAIAIVYFLLLPLVMLVVGAVRTSPYGTAGVWTLEGFATVVRDPRTIATLAATFAYAVFSTAGCMLLGLWFATAATRMATPLRHLIMPAMVALVATPRLFYALSWGMLGNPNSGLFAGMLHLAGVTEIPDWMTVYSWPGLVTVTGLKLTGFAYLLLYGPVSRAERSLEDAAVMSGVRRARAFVDITLTVLTPALLAAGMLIFVDVLQVFDLPAVLGLPAGIHTLPVRVNDYLLESGQPNWAAASALSLVTVLVIAGLLVVQHSIMHGKDYVVIGGRAPSSALAPVGRWRWAVDFSIAGFIAVAIVLPTAQIIIGSFQPFFGLYGRWTLNNYAAILADPDIVRTLAVTLGIAAGGGLAAVAAAFAMVYVMRHRPGTPLAWLARIGSWVPATAPGIVLSLALLWTYLNTPGLRLLYGTPWLLLFALIVSSIPVAVRAVEGIVAQIGQDVEEAARICGAGRVTAIVEITVLLCRPSLLAAWFLVGLGISGTLDVPLLLQSANSQTVATLSYSQYTYGYVQRAAATFCLYLAVVFVVVTALMLFATALRRLLRFATPAQEGFDAAH